MRRCALVSGHGGADDRSSCGALDHSRDDAVAAYAIELGLSDLQSVGMATERQSGRRPSPRCDALGSLELEIRFVACACHI